MKWNIFLTLLLLMAISAVYMGCSKYTNDAYVAPTPTPPTPPTPLPKNCIVLGIMQKNSGSTPEFSLSITYNSNLIPTKILAYDSLTNVRIFEASLAYISSDSIIIDKHQYIRLDNNKRVVRFKTKENIEKPTSSDDYLFEYKYNAEGYLIVKNLFINGASIPTYSTTYTYSNGLLTNCLMVLTNIGSKKVLESTITYDDKISPKTMFYVFPDGFENYYYSQALNFGSRPTRPPKQIITKVYDPAINRLLDTWKTDYIGYVLDGNGYITFANVTGDQQQGMPEFFGRTSFQYRCQ